MRIRHVTFDLLSFSTKMTPRYVWQIHPYRYTKHSIQNHRSDLTTYPRHHLPDPSTHYDSRTNLQNTTMNQYHRPPEQSNFSVPSSHSAAFTSTALPPDDQSSADINGVLGRRRGKPYAEGPSKFMQSFIFSREYDEEEEIERLSSFQPRRQQDRRDVSATQSQCPSASVSPSRGGILKGGKTFVSRHDTRDTARFEHPQTARSNLLDRPPVPRPQSVDEDDEDGEDILSRESAAERTDNRGILSRLSEVQSSMIQRSNLVNDAHIRVHGDELKRSLADLSKAQSDYRRSLKPGWSEWYNGSTPSGPLLAADAIADSAMKDPVWSRLSELFKGGGFRGNTVGSACLALSEGKSKLEGLRDKMIYGLEKGMHKDVTRTKALSSLCDSLAREEASLFYVDRDTKR